jgi:hypothetical protein
MSLLSGFLSLGKDVNKVKADSQGEGVVSELLPELELSMTDDELMKLARDWQKKWEPYNATISKVQSENEEYWMGKQFTASEGNRKMVDNLIFESLETFLPIATRPKADPLVESDNTEIGIAMADKVRKMLIHIADNLSFNLKMKQVARNWALYLLGAMKVGWSAQENDISCNVIRPQKLILDPDATIDECEYNGYYIGERLQDMARDLVNRFPKKADYIKNKVHDQMGTTVQYIMWTTDDYVFWTLDNEVLAKDKNPHWNYPTTQQAPMDEFGQIPVDPETGYPLEQEVEGINHFKYPKKPYVFLSIFNLGKQPHDETNLIQQNLPLQDLVNKRLVQIDKNADNANGGFVVSGDAFTEEQGKKFGVTMRKGGYGWVPTGDVRTAFMRDTGAALPNFVYESLIDYRNEMRNIFGTRGSTPQGTIKEQTLGGKQIIKGQDADRIGGGVSTYLEQFADKAMNWFVQLMYVYYDEPHSATVLGKEKAREYISIVNSEFSSKLLVGVKEGSMIPHDPVNKRSEAVELWKDNGIDPITFFDRLEFPNPREAAKNLYLWNADPIRLFPDLLEEQQQQMALQQAQMEVEQAEAGAVQTEQQDAQMAQQQEHELQKIAFANLAKGE